MYAENRDSHVFTIVKFLLTLLKGIIHCTINFFFVVYAFKFECMDKEGNLPGLWSISVCLFINILLIVTVDIFIHTKYHTWINCYCLILYIIYYGCT